MLQDSKIVLANSDWYVLRKMEDKYFIVSESPLFAGYYSLEMCPYPESRLAAFLQNKFSPYLERNGVDLTKASNISVPTLGQYNLYMKGRIPNVQAPFVTQTPDSENPDQIIAIDTDGNTFPAGVRKKLGIRPCMFIDATYAETVCCIVPVPIVDFEDQSPVQAPDIVPSVVQVQNDTETAIVPEPVKEILVEPEGVSAPLTVAVEPEPGREDVSSAPEPDPAIESETEIKSKVEDQTEPASESVEIVNESYSEEDVSDETAAIADTETIQVGDETVVVTNYGESKAAYVFAKDEDYKQYAVLYRQDAENVQQMLSDYSKTVLAFVNASRNDDRVEIDKIKVAATISHKTSRWRWKKKS